MHHSFISLGYLLTATQSSVKEKRDNLVADFKKLRNFVL